MAIYVPGKRDKCGRLKVAARSAVAVLSLTAMVDMFTVLVVFLLMNYQSTGEVIPMKENVDLPQASSVDELEPANVVVIDPGGIELNGKKFETFAEVKASQNWILPKLKKAIEKQIIKDNKEKKGSVAAKIQDAVKNAKAPGSTKAYIVRKVTIQADKRTDILSLKKVMYTITKAGGEEINFAVLKIPDKSIVPE